MKFEEVLAAMREGKKVCPTGAAPNFWMQIKHGSILNYAGAVCYFTPKMILAHDWTIIPDPEPEPVWLLLEPGMTIREGDEFIIGAKRQWRAAVRFGERVSAANAGLYRRRITKP